MGYAEIDVKHLKIALDAVLDHIIEDLGTQKLIVDEDQYWDIAGRQAYDLSKDPTDFSVGSLVDDIEFARKVRRGESYDSPQNLVHLWPQLRYLLEALSK